MYAERCDSARVSSLCAYENLFCKDLKSSEIALSLTVRASCSERVEWASWCAAESLDSRLEVRCSARSSVDLRAAVLSLSAAISFCARLRSALRTALSASAVASRAVFSAFASRSAANSSPLAASPCSMFVT